MGGETALSRYRIVTLALVACASIVGLSVSALTLPMAFAEGGTVDDLEVRVFADGPPQEALEYRVVSESHAILAIEERWVIPVVSYCVDASTRPPDMTAERFDDLVRQAANAVNTVGANTRVSITGPCATPASSGNGVNEVRFQANLSSFVEGEAIGLAQLRIESGTIIREADVSLELDLAPDGYPTSWAENPLCAVSVLAHEFGHTLGFNHSDSALDLMFTGGSCQVLRFTPSEASLIVAAYGADPSSVPVPPVGARPLLETFEQQNGTVTSWSPTLRWGTGTAGEVASGAFCGRDIIRGPAVDQCDLPEDEYWPRRGSGSLTLIPLQAGQTELLRDSGFELIEGDVTVCTASGCNADLPMIAGTAFVGSQVSRFSFVVGPSGAGARVVLLNAPYVEPGSSVEHSFTLRIFNPATNATLGQCTLGPGDACEQLVATLPAELAIVVVVGTGQGGVAFSTSTLATVVAPPPPAAPSGDAPFEGAASPTGLSLVMWTGGSPESAAAAVPLLKTIWITIDGQFIGYVLAAPGFVNQRFLGTVGGEIPAGLPVLLVAG